MFLFGKIIKIEYITQMNTKKLILGIIIGGIFGVIAVLIMIILYDKSKKKTHDGFQLVANDSTANEQVRLKQVLVYGDYIDLDSTDYLLIPLGMETVESDERKGKIKSSEEYLPYDESFKNFKYNFYSLNSIYNNIVFYDKRTDSTHLLLQIPAMISQFYFPYYNEEYKGKKYWFLLMGIRENDSDADGYINSMDAETIYISDLSGNNRVQISPDNTQLIDWYVDAETNTILMKIREDSNDDKIFNYSDDIEIIRTSIDSPAIGKEIINESMKANLTKILRKIK